MAFVWPQNLSRNAAELISPEERTLLSFPPKFHQESENASLLVVVCSAVGNVHQRAAVRGSWARAELTPAAVRVLFLVGVSRNATENEAILDEQNLYGDLIQEQFIDSYANLTIKSLMLLKWFLSEEQKSSARFALKTDDDMYVNLEFLQREIVEKIFDDSNLLLGNLICGAGVIRDPYNKWYAPAYMYTGKVYPNYLSGTAYLMGKGAAKALFEAALTEPVFHLEDIYVTGVLARKAKVRPKDDYGFTYLKRNVANACLYWQTVSSHHLTAKEMYQVSENLMALQGKKCKKLSNLRRRPYGPGKCKWP